VEAVTLSRWKQGFGIAVGSDVYFLLNPTGRALTGGAHDLPVYSTSGTYDFGNGNSGAPVLPCEYSAHPSIGVFTFTNATYLTGDDAAFAALDSGKITCHRDPSWPWWRQSASPWLLLLWVPVYAFLQCIKQLQPIRSREMAVMWLIACLGYLANLTANKCAFDAPLEQLESLTPSSSHLPEGVSAVRRRRGD
jgi:hypothetical protein